MASKIEPAFAIWITGLPASGKSTITAALKKLLDERGVDVAILESDVLRRVFSENPRYGAEGRDVFYKQMLWLGSLLVHHGVPVIFDATANLRRYRADARNALPRFLEVFVDVPLEVCIERDPKGIYRSGAAGRSSDVPGAQAPYEPPEHAEVRIDGLRETPEESARRILEAMKENRFI